MACAPVIYIFFNRPEPMRRSFGAIRAARPPRLHLIADGPRTDKAGEAERCAEARAYVESKIDWPCEVTRDFSKANLGCGRRLCSGLTTAFELLGEAIVVEDDVVPHPDFWTFCTELLARHRSDERVFAINGFQPLQRYRPSSGARYVPTVFNNIWGWASWQRAWRHYDFSLQSWKESGVRESLRDFLMDPLIADHFARAYDEVATGRIDTWDFQWMYAMHAHRGLALVADRNLVDNIGFDPDATHTHEAAPYFAGLRTTSLSLNSQCPPLHNPDRLHDRLYAQTVLSQSPKRIRVARWLARWPALRMFFPQFAR